MTGLRQAMRNVAKLGDRNSQIDVTNLKAYVAGAEEQLIRLAS